MGRRLSSTASALRRSPTAHGGPTPHGGWVLPERWAELNFPRVSKSASPIPYTFDTLVTGMYRTATRNTSSAPALPYWYQTSTTTLRTMQSPRECVSPLLLQPDRFFQSSKTTNSSGRMLCNKQAVFEKVQDNDSTKNAIFESNIFPFTHESIRLFYFVTMYKNSLHGILACRLGDFALNPIHKF